MGCFRRHCAPEAKRGATVAGATRVIFGRNNVYVELQRHFRPEQEHRNHAAIDLARELSLPLLATNGVLYATADDRHVLDALTCVKHKCTLDEAGQRLQINGERHVRNCEEMMRSFRICQRQSPILLSSRQSLEFTLEKLGYEFPQYPVPSGETAD